MDYVIRDDGVLIRSDGALIPQDPGNADFMEYLRAVQEGYEATQLPPTQPFSPPVVVSRFKARAALLQAGHLDEVQAWMDRPETPDIVRLAWDEVLEFRRDSLLLMSVAIALDMSSTQVDDLFAAAALIEV